MTITYSYIISIGMQVHYFIRGSLQIKVQVNTLTGLYVLERCGPATVNDRSLRHVRVREISQVCEW